MIFIQNCNVQSYNPIHKEAIIHVWKRNFKWEAIMRKTRHKHHNLIQALR